MKKYNIKGSNILVGERLENISQYIPKKSTVIITDRNVAKYHKKDFPDFPVIEIESGEAIKTLDTISEIIDQLVRMEADRNWFILGIGGGIVCDIAGFVASVFMRGMDFGFIPSTLLAMVDASVGGKNGVNFKGYKNLIGNFNQPKFVLCDFNLLQTLPGKEISNGFAEIIKHCLIADEKMFGTLNSISDKALSLTPDTIETLVAHSVSIKSKIVSDDEKEKGSRKLLNFGHTLGHSLEKNLGISHGQAVSLGMVFASEISVKKKLLKKEELIQIKNTLTNYQLPIQLEFDRDAVYDSLKMDKKRKSDYIPYILLEKPGKGIISPLSMKELEVFVHSIKLTD